MKCVYLWKDVSTEGLMLGREESIVRISDELARDLVADGSASYMPKKFYKRYELRGSDSVQYIYNPSYDMGSFKSSRTVELYSGRDGIILGDYNAAGDLCGVEVIGDVEQATVALFTVWQ